MNVDIGAEAALFPEKEYIKRIAVAVQRACKIELNCFIAVQWCNKDPRCKKLQLTDLLVAPVHHIMKVFIICTW
jgi:hypothetical protein